MALTQEEINKRRQTNKKILKFGCLPIIGLIVLSVVFSIFGKDDKPTKEDLAVMSYVIAKDYVKNSLRYPEEAEFDLLPISKKETKPNIFEVVGNVTAKNGFGVKEKKAFRCYIKYTGGEPALSKNWQLLEEIEFR